MVLDFVLLDKIKEFVECFDHSYSLWAGEKPEVKEFVDKFNSRIIEMPVSPSAEGYALIFYYVFDKILKNTTFTNEEGNVQLNSVRVHETRTGYAEAFEDDRHMMDFELSDIKYSQSIIDDWKDLNWWNDLLNNNKFTNPEIPEII